MKPPIIPSLERGETHQITPWNLAQRGRKENKHTPGLRPSKTELRPKTAKRRPKLGVKKTADQLTLQEAFGSHPRSISTSNNDPQIPTCKKFGNKLEPKKKLLFRCATHNINNMPESSWTPKSKEIAAMATGRDGADIRMWQEIGLYWPKVNELDKWGKRIKGQCYKTKAIFSYNNLEHEITSVRQPGGTAIIFN